MAIKKYEGSINRISTQTNVQESPMNFRGLAEVNAQRTSQQIKSLNLIRSFAADQFKKEAVKKAAERAAKNDPYAEYMRTKESMGLEDRLTFELNLSNIQDDYLFSVEEEIKDLEINGLLTGVSSDEFNQQVDISVRKNYQKLITRGIDSPQFELDTRKTIDPFVRRYKINYKDKLLSKTKKDRSKSIKKLLKRYAKYAGVTHYNSALGRNTDDTEQAANNYEELKLLYPDVYAANKVELENARRLEMGESLVKYVNNFEAGDLDVQTAQTLHNVLSNEFELNAEDTESELYRKVNQAKERLKKITGVSITDSQKDAETFINLSFSEALDELNTDRTKDALSIQSLIAKGIISGDINDDNYQDKIKNLKNIAFPPGDISIKEKNGTISMGPMLLETFEIGAQQSFEKFYTTYRDEYNKDPTKAVENIFNIKRTAVDSNGLVNIDTVKERIGANLSPFTNDEMDAYYNRSISITKPNEAFQYETNFWSNFTLQDLESIPMSMLENIEDVTQRNFVLQNINSQMQQRKFILNGEASFANNGVKHVYQGSYILSNIEPNSADKTSADEIFNKVIEFTDERVTHNMLFSKGIDAQSVKKTLNDSIYSYLIGKNGLSETNDDAIEEAYVFASGALFNPEGEQTSGYVEIEMEGAGKNSNIIHINAFHTTRSAFDDNNRYQPTIDDITEGMDYMDLSVLKASTYMKMEDGSLQKFDGNWEMPLMIFHDRVTLKDFNEQATKDVETLKFDVGMLKENFNAENDFNYPSMFTFNSQDVYGNKTVIRLLDGNGVERDIVIDLNEIGYNYKIHLEPHKEITEGNIAYQQAENLYNQGFVNIGDGTIPVATATKRVSKPRPGDIFINTNTGEKIIFNKTNAAFDNKNQIIERSKLIGKSPMALTGTDSIVEQITSGKNITIEE